MLGYTIVQLLYNWLYNQLWFWTWFSHCEFNQMAESINLLRNKQDPHCAFKLVKSTMGTINILSSRNKHLFLFRRLIVISWINTCIRVSAELSTSMPVFLTASDHISTWTNNPYFFIRLKGYWGKLLPGRRRKATSVCHDGNVIIAPFSKRILSHVFLRFSHQPCDKA